MCGIFGIWSATGGIAREDVMAPMAALAHRGPDGSGTWADADGAVALAHTRLALVGLRWGAQPIASPDGRVQLVVNGEFYDHARIRRGLERDGAVFSTDSDSEIALHLYLARGDEALHALRGEFALILWDGRRRRLLAARDRFGIKPLFYVRHEGRLLIASEMKALVAAGVRPRWDEAAMLEHLHLAMAADRTPFADIRQLPPGHLLSAAPDGLALARYWDLDYPRPDELVPEEEFDAHLARVAAALEEAVATRQAADVPVAAHLSGGIDSSSIAALARRRGPTTTFTVRFDDAAYDESGVARRTAGYLDAEHHEMPFHAGDFDRRLPETIRCGEMVAENAHATARLLQSEHIHAHGYKAVLAGEGGDELFAGYPQFQHDLALTLAPGQRERARESYARLGPDGVPRHMRTLLDALGFVPNWVLDRHLGVGIGVRALLHPDVRADFDACDPARALLDSSDGQLDGRSPLHQSLYLFFKSRLPNYILAAERLDMAHAVEVRLPYLDHGLFDVVKRTPLTGYTRDGVTKFALRAAIGDGVPGEVRNGSKHGFFAPPVVATDAGLGALRERLSGGALRGSPFFDAASVLALVDDLAARPPDRRTGADAALNMAVGSALLAGAYGLEDPA